MKWLKNFFKSKNDNSETFDVRKYIDINVQVIKNLKSIQSGKYNENSLYEYIYSLSDLQILYNGRDAKRLNIDLVDDIVAIDLKFIQKLLEYNYRYDNELIRFTNNYGDSALSQVKCYILKFNIKH